MGISWNGGRCDLQETGNPNSREKGREEGKLGQVEQVTQAPRSYAIFPPNWQVMTLSHPHREHSPSWPRLVWLGLHAIHPVCHLPVFLFGKSNRSVGLELRFLSSHLNTCSSTSNPFNPPTLLAQSTPPAAGTETVKERTLGLMSTYSWPCSVSLPWCLGERVWSLKSGQPNPRD